MSKTPLADNRPDSPGCDLLRVLETCMNSPAHSAPTEQILPEASSSRTASFYGQLLEMGAETQVSRVGTKKDRHCRQQPQQRNANAPARTLVEHQRRMQSTTVVQRQPSSSLSSSTAQSNVKETSKTAARNRREKENREFAELAGLLPLPWAITSQLDKASVVRLAASYLHMRNFFPEGLSIYPPSLCDFFDLPIIREPGSHMMQTLEGFVFILSDDGRVIYISETASVCLGLSQVELTGNNIFDYLHPSDAPCMTEVLRNDSDILSLIEPSAEVQDIEFAKAFTIRLKCVLAKRNAGLTYHGYRVVHCNGYLKMKLHRSLDGSKLSITHLGMIGIGTTLPANSATEYRLPSTSFLLRTSLDLKIIFLDARVSEITGYHASDLLDCSLYNYVPVSDLPTLKDAHKCLFSKNQAITEYYRFLTKNGGWIWVQSQLALIQNPRSSRPHCIVFVTNVISDDPCVSYILQTEQMSSHSDGPDEFVSKLPSTSGTQVGVYSERFYGPNGVLLATKLPLEDECLVLQKKIKFC